MVAVLLGLAASASFSCADFFGGVAARRSNAWLSVLANQAIGLIPLTVYRSSCSTAVRPAGTSP